MTEFYWECHKTAMSIMSAMALGVGLDDENYFIPTHSGHNNQLRLLHYPPVPAANIERQTSTRMGAHSDWGSITMVFQDDCGGLQVSNYFWRIASLQADRFQIENPNKSGEFIDVPPLKDAVVMNIGDLMMRWSNGRYRKTRSRSKY